MRLANLRRQSHQRLMNGALTMWGQASKATKAITMMLK
jgi:hypothetical protein